MAHELAFKNGVGLVFSVRETPWHREGHVLADNPGYHEAIQLVGLNYPMQKLPYHRPLPDGTTVQSNEAYYIFRSDTQMVLGSVGSQYEVVTNEEAFAPLQPLVDQGVLKLETGGVLREGADAWLLGQWDLSKFGDIAKQVFGNEILPYATVMANHSGRRGILLGSTSIRICCSNTLGAAERDGVSRWTQINHRAGAQSRLFEAANEMFNRVVEKFDIIARQYRLLMKTTLTPGNSSASSSSTWSHPTRDSGRTGTQRRSWRPPSWTGTNGRRPRSRGSGPKATVTPGSLLLGWLITASSRL